MSKEEKELLLKDLCARLPYGVKVLHRGQVHKLFTIDGREVNNACIRVDGYDAWFSVDTVKPYLRQMSSMTEEEEIYYNTIYTRLKFYEKEDWLNAHHFDYRGLIEKGLALVASKDIYNG